MVVSRWPKLGCGVGLRTERYDLMTREWLRWAGSRRSQRTSWILVGRPLHILEAVRARYSVALHGVSLSIGSTDPLDRTYLQRLKVLADRIDPVIVSDHLCWTNVDSENLHDLLPLPFAKHSPVATLGRNSCSKNDLPTGSGEG